MSNAIFETFLGIISFLGIFMGIIFVVRFVDYKKHKGFCVGYATSCSIFVVITILAIITNFNPHDHVTLVICWMVAFFGIIISPLWPIIE